MANMTSHARVLATGRRQQTDRAPRWVSCESAVATALHAQLGATDLDDFFGADLSGWGIGLLPSERCTNFAGYFYREGVTWDEWGRGRVWDAADHYAEYLYPLERAESLADIVQYPWPDLSAPYRYRDLEARVAEAHARGRACMGGIGETIFEIAWQLRSMERLFEDMLTDDEMAVYLLDTITDARVAMARGMARAGVDILLSGDDVAMQHGLMMSRELFNRWFAPRLRRIFDAAREEKPDILIWFHSDGKIDDLIPDLLALGVDILNPVQPECVDHAWVKATYGDRLSFSGGLGVQSVLPFGTPDEVAEHVRTVMATLGKDGGLIIGPSHVLERDTPLENIIAMRDALDRYGVYA